MQELDSATLLTRRSRWSWKLFICVCTISYDCTDSAGNGADAQVQYLAGGIVAGRATRKARLVMVDVWSVFEKAFHRNYLTVVLTVVTLPNAGEYALMADAG